MLKCGIIPTRMGTSTQDRIYTTFSQDHPHAYGDKTMRCYVRRAQNGSSPRVWGQADDLTDTNGGKRIIPTRMGTSLSYILRWILIEDHPHAYGDKFLHRSIFSLSRGSSPRVWGQVDADFTVDLSVRIIPTRMGTS